MNCSRFLSPRRAFAALSAVGLGLLPAIAAAHPGHYHPPGEEDEFDAFASGLQMLPNWQSILIAAAIVGTIAVMVHKKNTPAL